ncbi:hypothetical protein [Nonomuraea sp. NPDC002799]
MGVHAVAQFEIERVEELALELLADGGQVGGKLRELAEQLRVLLRRSTRGQCLELFGLRLPHTGQVGVPALETFTEVPVNVLVTAGYLFFDLGQDVVLPLPQIKNLPLEPIPAGVAL